MRRDVVKICEFGKLKRGAEFLKCYNFKQVPTITLKFTKHNDNSALRMSPTVFEGRPIYFHAKQPVAPILKVKRKTRTRKTK